MLELKFVRAHPEVVRSDLHKRADHQKLGYLDELLKCDALHRSLLTDLENLRARRNSVSREVSEAVKSKAPEARIEGLKAEASALPSRIRALESETEKLQEQVRHHLMRLPNVLHESVPVGKDSSENVQVKAWGEPSLKGFDLKAHGELAQEMAWVDFERAAKVSGQGFVFLKGSLAVLELAIVRLGVDLLVKKGFTPVQTPMMLNRQPYEGVTDLADFENVMYKVEGHDAYLIATSEHPLAAMYAGEVIDEEHLPINLAGISACFRKEIGGHGVDQKGLFRMHQFNKVEQFVFCTPEESWGIHEKLLENTEEFWRLLKIPYRVVNICTGDIGNVAAKKYDVEAWFPRKQAYAEVASCSNCTSYQAVRLGIKYRLGKQGAFDERKEFVHTLNNTMVATSRAMVAILENYQNPDGTVDVPKALQKYVSFKKLEKE